MTPARRRVFRRAAMLAALAAVGRWPGPALADQAASSVYGTVPVFQAPSSPPPMLVPVLPATATVGLKGGIEPPEQAPPDADRAFGAFQRGYFATALTEAMDRLKGQPKDGAAMALIGEIYAQGLAVKRDPGEAARWNRLAADQGNREAIFSYGLALLTGDGVPKDRAAARALFEKAGAAGHAGALYNLGVMAIEGDGKTRDFQLAAVFFQRAAEAGDIDALFALATLYQSGRGVPQDLRRAAELMKQAAEQKHVGAQVEYGIMLFNGKGVERNESEAAHYFTRAAYQGNPIAENRLARLYAAGRGVARDRIESARWHILARAAGIPDLWLDDQLASLSPADKTKVEDVIRRQLGP